MNLSYVLQDEKLNGGSRINVRQGEIKTIQVFWFKANGAPYVGAGITEIELSIYKGVATPALLKKLSLTTVALINSDTLSGAIGFSFSLSAAESAALPISSSVGMSAKVKVSTSAADEQDFPAAFNVTAPLVS